ncbi:MAG: nucleoside hydrolase [Candidatus Rokubacteria bacterium]|nr:nucleoside hydrolase [Candidatus Rokubacteria bacterium]
MKIPLLVDTDPGIDDALALVLALRSPQCSVESITTVAGNVSVERCTLNMFRILDVLKPERLPVVSRGADKPLARSLVSAPHVHGDDGLGNLAELKAADGSLRYPRPRLTLSPLDGPDLILDTIGRFPGELVLVALGPLTNLALALQRDARRMALLRRLVIMGGAVGVPGNVTPVAEFNFYVDPEAAAQVLASGLPIELVPLDITRNAILPRSVLQKRLAVCPDPVSRFVADMTQRGFEFAEEIGEGGITLHDPVALGIALDPSLTHFEPVHVAVECEGVLTRGMSVADLRMIAAGRKAPATCRVARGLRADTFLDLFLDRLCPASW